VSREPEAAKARALGMALTFTSLVTAALMNIPLALGF